MSTVICTPVKDCQLWLQRYLQQLDKLEATRIIFSYGQSKDATLDLLKKWSEVTEHAVEVYREPLMKNAPSSAAIGAIYRQFQEKVEDEEYVLLGDSDIMQMPPTLIDTLIAHDKDIIAPYVWTLFHDSPHQLFYDTYVFRYNGLRFHPFRPPLNDGAPFQLDSVGTCILVKNEPFKATPYPLRWPHMKFCNESREKGYEVWADPSTVIYHLDPARFNIQHEQLEILEARQRGDPNPYRFADRTGFIKEGFEEISIQQLQEDYLKAYIWGIIE